jgi:hypothetical protein
LEISGSLTSLLGFSILFQHNEEFPNWMKF